MVLAQAARAGVRRHLAMSLATQLLSRPFAKLAEHIVGTSPPPEKDLEIKKQKTVEARSLSLDPSSEFRVVEDPADSYRIHIFLKYLGYYRKSSRLVRGANVLYSRISFQVDQPVLYAKFGLEQSSTTHEMLVLYMWLLLCRLRSEGKDGGAMCRSLYDAFNRDMEGRLIGVGRKECVSKFIKSLEQRLYGAVAAYDMAVRPEADKDELAWALWRNIFAEDDSIDMPTGPNSTSVHALTRHVRREAACLTLTDLESFLIGNILFTNDFGAVTE